MTSRLKNWFVTLCFLGVIAALSSWTSLAIAFDLDIPFKKELSVQKTSSLKVLWWNAAGFQINPQSLSSNLKQLIGSSNAPDLLIFSEAPPLRQMKDLRHFSFFNKKFRYKKHFAYSKKNKNGLLIFSKYKIKLVSKKSLRPFNLKKLKQNPSYQTPFWIRFRKSFSNHFRTALHLRVKKNQQIHNIYTTHLLNPWFSYMKTYQDKSNNKTFVNLRLFLNMQNQAYNPLVYQASLFKIFVEKALTKSTPNQTHLIVGDFNAPDRTIPDNYSFSHLSRPSLAYVFLSSRLNKILEHHYTIPTLDYLQKRKNNPHITSKKPFFMVDHAFTGLDTKALTAMVLPFKGSDHYPLFIEIE